MTDQEFLATPKLRYVKRVVNGHKVPGATLQQFWLHPNHPEEGEWRNVPLVVLTETRTDEPRSATEIPRE